MYSNAVATAVVPVLGHTKFTAVYASTGNSSTIEAHYPGRSTHDSRTTTAVVLSTSTIYKNFKNATKPPNNSVEGCVILGF